MQCSVQRPAATSRLRKEHPPGSLPGCTFERRAVSWLEERLASTLHKGSVCMTVFVHAASSSFLSFVGSHRDPAPTNSMPFPASATPTQSQLPEGDVDKLATVLSRRLETRSHVDKLAARPFFLLPWLFESILLNSISSTPELGAGEIGR